MQNDLLIVEELMLLLLHDEGVAIAGAGTLHYTLGGAVLVELALQGRIAHDDSRSLNGPRVRQAGEGDLEDPLLQAAYDKVAEKDRRVQPLILALSEDLRVQLLERLESRGLIRKEESRFLGVFRTTRWPAEDERHEAELRERIGAVLVDGQEPDPHTAAVIALLSASGAMYAVRPQLPLTSQALARAKEIEKGNWGAGAVATAVNRTAAAIAASAAAVTVSTTVAAT